VEQTLFIPLNAQFFLATVARIFVYLADI